SGEPKPIVRSGSVAGVSHAAGRLFFTLQGISRPPEVHVCGPEGEGVTRISRFTDAVTSRFGLGEVRELQFEGSYGESVQMFLALPHDYQEGKKYPLIQVIHGGPHATSPDAFHLRWNPHLFAAPGYIAAMVNFQGSTGWGQDFAKRILGAWGDRPFE